MTLSKAKIPLLFFVLMSLWWAFYYQSHSELNDYGQANFEWLYLIDALLLTPLLCFFCISSKKEAAIKALLLSCLAILVGSYMIPESQKFIWHYLETGRYLLLALIVLMELIAIATVCVAIRAALCQQQDPDQSIEKPLKAWLGDSPVLALLQFETRLWTYLLFGGQIKPQQFHGEQHFFYHQKDGTQSNLLGFILVFSIEMPLLHLLLHFVWSPVAATVVTGLTLVSLLFFIAEYRAVSRRPISLSAGTLIIRYGLSQPLVLPPGAIAGISRCDGRVKKAAWLKKYNLSGNPNLCITLAAPVGALRQIYLGVDQPELLIIAVQQAQCLTTDTKGL